MWRPIGGTYYPADAIIQELRANVGPIFDAMEAGVFDSAESINSNAQSFISAMTAPNQELGVTTQ